MFGSLLAKLLADYSSFQHKSWNMQKCNSHAKHPFQFYPVLCAISPTPIPRFPSPSIHLCIFRLFHVLVMCIVQQSLGTQRIEMNGGSKILSKDLPWPCFIRGSWCGLRKVVFYTTPMLFSVIMPVLSSVIKLVVLKSWWCGVRDNVLMSWLLGSRLINL